MAALEDPDAPAALRALLVADPALAGVAIDVVPAARTIAVTHAPGAGDAVWAAVERAVRAVAALPGRGAGVGGVASGDAIADAAAGPLVEIPVTYDGEDLADVGLRAGCCVEEVVARHAGAEYRVAFCGFAPGFAYLRGLDARLVLPRRDVPRPRVPAGSVAIAAEYSAVYPGSSPGGWHLLGTTRLTMWDPRDAAAPARLVPGMRVRFVPERA
jgi:KipI family sensor histidine kinase inhibitor